MPDLDDAALVLVDVQNDFCPGGALQVRDGDQVIAPLNRQIERFQRAGRPIIASRDWHPERTSHFQSGGGPWPVHCVAGEPGARFHAELRLPPDAIVLSKGTSPTDDGYSAFEARGEDGRPLDQILRANGTTHIVVGGLATDYCVAATVHDAIKAGYRITVLTDAIRGVDLKPGDSERAIDDMRRAGATFE